MRKLLAAVWLSLTLLPFGYFAYFIEHVVSMWGIEGGRDFQRQQAQFDLLFKVHIAAMLLICILIASYIIYLFRTERVPKDKKALWAVVLFMGGIIAMPVFWFIYVWKPLQVADSTEGPARPNRV
jgi:uncharacterized membrane protein (DUF485 family)